MKHVSFYLRNLVWGMHFLSRAICKCSSKTFFGMMLQPSFIHSFCWDLLFSGSWAECSLNEMGDWVWLPWSSINCCSNVSVSWFLGWLALPPFICGLKSRLELTLRPRAESFQQPESVNNWALSWSEAKLNSIDHELIDFIGFCVLYRGL